MRAALIPAARFALSNVDEEAAAEALMERDGRTRKDALRAVRRAVEALRDELEAPRSKSLCESLREREIDAIYGGPDWM